MLSKFLLVCGVFALTLALRSYRHPVMQKLGALGIMATSFLTGYLLSGSRAVGALCAATWILLPWLDLLTRIRKLTLPLERSLRHKSPPGSQTFPALSELTEEVEGAGFEHIDDAGWDWEEYEQFFRLFYKADERVQAAICLVDQQDIAFYYLSLSSRAKDGTIWTTWNYPFSYSLKLAPAVARRSAPGRPHFSRAVRSAPAAPPPPRRRAPEGARGAQTPRRSRWRSRKTCAPKSRTISRRASSPRPAKAKSATPGAG